MKPRFKKMFNEAFSESLKTMKGLNTKEAFEQFYSHYYYGSLVSYILLLHREHNGGMNPKDVLEEYINALLINSYINSNTPYGQTPIDIDEHEAFPEVSSSFLLKFLVYKILEGKCADIFAPYLNFYAYNDLENHEHYEYIEDIINGNLSLRSVPSAIMACILFIVFAMDIPELDITELYNIYDFQKYSRYIDMNIIRILDFCSTFSDSVLYFKNLLEVKLGHGV